MDADLIGESASTSPRIREVRGHIHVHRIQTIRVLLSYSVVTLEMKKAILAFKLGKQYRLSRPGSPRCLFTGTGYCKTFTHCDSGSLSLVDVCEG